MVSLALRSVSQQLPPLPDGFVLDQPEAQKPAQARKPPPPPPGFVLDEKPQEAPAPEGFRYVDDPLSPGGRGLQPIPQKESWADRAKAGVADAVGYMAAPLTQNQNPAMRMAGEVGQAVGTGIGQWGVTTLTDPVEGANQAVEAFSPMTPFSEGYQATGEAGQALARGDIGEAANQAVRAVAGYGGAALSLIPGGGAARQAGAAPARVAPREVLGSLAAEALDAPVRPQALDAISRILINSGVPRDRVNAGLGRVVDLLKEPASRAATVAQLLQREFGEEFPQVVDNVNIAIRERGLSSKPGDASPSIVRETAQQMRGSQTGFLTESAGRNLGNAPVAPARQAAEQTQVPRIIESARNNLGADARGVTREQMEGRLRAIGQEGYEPLLGQQIDPERVGRIQAVLNGPGMGELGRPLRQIAAGEGIDLAQMIERDPLRAAHWMQHRARQLSEENAGTALGGAYSSMRNRILRQLDDLQAPDGRTYADLRREYGDEVGIGQALNAGDRFGAQTANPEGARQFIVEFQGMTPPQQQAALASIRDWVIQKVGGGQEGAPARLAELTKMGVLDALDAIGGGAAALARDLRAIRDESTFWGNASAVSRDFGGIAGSPERAAEFIAHFQGMAPDQQQTMLGAVREWVQQRLLGSQQDAPARISEMSKLGVLDTLDRLGPGGQALARDIRAIREENDFLAATTNRGQSATIPNAQALKEGPKVYSRGPGSLGTVGTDVIGMLTGAWNGPMNTVLKGSGVAFDKIGRPLTRTREDMTRILMARQKEAQRAADAPTGPTSGLGGPADTSAQPATALGATPEAAASPAMMPERNAAPVTALGAVGGGTYGYNAPLDLNGDGEISEEERMASGLVGTALGGVGGAALGRAASRLDARAQLPRGTAQQTFAGVNAKTADRVALAKAEEMAAAGASRDDIWRETGWFKGVDGKWRFEIDDSGARFNIDAMRPEEYTISGRSISAKTGKVGQTLDSRPIYEAYPKIGDLTMVQGRGDQNGIYSGSFSSRSGIEPSISINLDRLKTEPQRRSVGLHEVQHGIQDIEGFAEGGSAEYLRSIPNPDARRFDEAIRNDPEMGEFQRIRQSAEYHAEIDANNRMWREEYAPQYDAIEERAFASPEEWDRLKPQMDAILASVRAETRRRFPIMRRIDELSESLRAKGLPFDRPRETLSGDEIYRRLAGEVEARNVQTRRDFTPEQRRARAPWETQDVPDDQQIVRFGSEGPQASVSFLPRRKPAEPPAMDLAPDQRIFGPGRPDDLGFITSGERALTQLPKKFADAKALTADQWRSAMRAGGTSNEGFTYQVDPALASFEPGRKITRAELEEAMARNRETLSAGGSAPRPGTAEEKLRQRIEADRANGKKTPRSVLARYNALVVQRQGGLGTLADNATTETYYGEYISPGSSSDYVQETLISPTAAREGYKSHNWRAPGVVGHNRTTIRETATGERVTHADELQSDLHQEGAKYGYASAEMAANSRAMDKAMAAAERAELKWNQWAEKNMLSPFDASATPDDIKDPVGRELMREMQAAYERLDAFDMNSSTYKMPPNAPMQDWEGPMVQRVLLRAIENGTDLVTFPTHATLHKALKNEGTQKFYDERLPRTLQRIAKQLGAKFETANIGADNAAAARWRADIAEREKRIEKLRKSIFKDDLDQIEIQQLEEDNELARRAIAEVGKGSEVPAIRLTPEAKKKLAQGVVMYGGAGVVATGVMGNALTADQQGAQ